MLPINRKKQIADCEVCDKTNVEVTMAQPGNILMCDTCLADNDAAVAASKVVNRIVEESRKVDSTIQMKADIFMAKTVPITQLKAAIDHDENIPTDQKQYVFVKQLDEHIKILKRAAFDKRTELNDIETELRAYQVNAQDAAGRLRADLRAQFKELDINYEPVTITKKQKTTKPVTAAKKFDKKALYEACKKYGVPAHAVQMMVTSKNMPIEAAAKKLAEQMGLL
jgi:hypothetical protein